MILHLTRFYPTIKLGTLARCGMQRIYLDVCCLSRPFDARSQPRIRLEAEAVSQFFMAVLLVN